MELDTYLKAGIRTDLFNKNKGLIDLLESFSNIIKFPLLEDFTNVLLKSLGLDPLETPDLVLKHLKE